MQRSVFACLMSLLLAMTPLVGLSAAAAPVDEPSATPHTQGLQNQWFFAEGATTPPFDTWLLLYNPNSVSVTATVTFFGTAGVIATREVTISPNDRASLFVNEILPNATFGMRVNSPMPIAAERAMYFRHEGTAVVGAASPLTEWLFAEGATAFPFHTWFLMLNPNEAPATATLTFFFEGGGSQTTTVVIPPLSRASVFANQVLPPTAFSTRISSDQPIVAERSMFQINTGSGHASVGAGNAEDSWFFAEGATVTPFDTWFLLFNPNATPVRILMRLFPDVGGPGPLLDFTIPANSRSSVFANQILPNRSFGATILTEGGPIVAERAMYFRGGSHGTVGAPTLSTGWFFAEGSTAAPFQEWILLMNPSGADNATATLTFFLDGQTVTRTVTVPSQGRASLFLDQFLPQTAVATRVISDMPIVAERSMYFSEGNAGHNVVGIHVVSP